jgi:hypothetical protein
MCASTLCARIRRWSTRTLSATGGGCPFGSAIGQLRGAAIVALRRARSGIERDPTIEITPIGVEDYGTIRIHNAYIRYLLPMMVEVQFYERIEVRPA